MTTPTVRTVAPIPAPAPPKPTPLQILLAVADAIDNVAGDFLTRRELAAFTNVRLRQTAIREAELESRRAA